MRTRCEVVRECRDTEGRRAIALSEGEEKTNGNKGHDYSYKHIHKASQTRLKIFIKTHYSHLL